MSPIPFGFADPSIGSFPDIPENLLTTFMAIYMIIMALAYGFSILIYVLSSLGMYTIANRRGIHHPWLAWIPIGNAWILGSISDQYQYVAKGKIRNKRKLLLGLNITMVVMTVAFMIMGFVLGFQVGFAGEMPDSIGLLLGFLGSLLVFLILDIILMIFLYVAYYDLFISCNPSNGVVFLVLSILFSFLLPFFVFACRKKDLGMPPKKPRLEQPLNYGAEPQWQPQEAPQWQAPVQPEAQPVEASEPAPDEEPRQTESTEE